MKRILSIIITLTALQGCTPELRHHFQKEWDTAKEYDYLETAKEVSGWRTIKPTPEQAVTKRNNELCLHEDSHERNLTANGINDRVYYRGCVLSPSLGVQYPQRLDGR